MGTPTRRELHTSSSTQPAVPCTRKKPHLTATFLGGASLPRGVRTMVAFAKNLMSSCLKPEIPCIYGVSVQV